MTSCQTDGHCVFTLGADQCSICGRKKSVPGNGCKTCRWAKWERTATGRISTIHAGTCLYVVPMPPLPISVTASFDYRKDFGRSKIHVGMGASCPTFEEKPK